MLNEISKYLLKENDLFISLTGNVGRVGLLDKCFLPAALNQRVACLRIKNNSILDKRYLFYLMNTDKFEMDCVYSSKGIAQKNMSTEWLKEYDILIPPLTIQQQLVNLLKKLDFLITKQKMQIIKLDLLVKSRFVEMFGDPVANPMGWKKIPLGELGELNRGISKHRPRNAPELMGGDYPLIQTGEISEADLYVTDYSTTYSEIGFRQSKMWPKGTLCITIAANIAKTAILNFDTCFPDSVVGFISGARTNQLFIHFWFSFFQKMLEEQAPESAQKNINLQILRRLEVILPPLSLQKEFAEFVQQTDKSKFVMQKGLEKLEMSYKALVQQYFG